MTCKGLRVRIPQHAQSILLEYIGSWHRQTRLRQSTFPNECRTRRACTLRSMPRRDARRGGVYSTVTAVRSSVLCQLSLTWASMGACGWCNDLSNSNNDLSNSNNDTKQPAFPLGGIHSVSVAHMNTVVPRQRTHHAYAKPCRVCPLKVLDIPASTSTQYDGRTLWRGAC